MLEQVMAKRLTKRKIKGSIVITSIPYTCYSLLLSLSGYFDDSLQIQAHLSGNFYAVSDKFGF